jgi:hypothetical protein
MVHPVEGGARRHRNARLGVVDDGCEHGVEAELSVILRQAAERVDRTGDSDGLRRAEQRHAHVPGCPYLRRRQGRRRTAGSVERDHVLAARRFHQREAIAADPGHRGFAQPQKHASRDRGIHRVSARLQDVDRHFSRQGVRRRAHPVFRKNGRPARLMEIPHVSLPSCPVAQPTAPDGDGKGLRRVGGGGVSAETSTPRTGWGLDTRDAEGSLCSYKIGIATIRGGDWCAIWHFLGRDGELGPIPAGGFAPPKGVHSAGRNAPSGNRKREPVPVLLPLVGQVAG